MSNHRFHQSERLKSEKRISYLFSGKANSFAVFPVRIIWALVDEAGAQAVVQAAFSVPKRKFPKAPHRNLLKRRLREAYRLQKGKLYESLDLPEGKQLALLLLYTDKQKSNYERIEASVRRLLKRLPKEVRRQLRPTDEGN